MYPSHFPQDCPPPDARSPRGPLFAVVKHDPPRAADFLSHYERGLQRGGTPCRRRGISLSTTWDDAKQITRLFPRLGGFIARGRLDADSGHILRTSGPVPTHHTWWAPEGLERESLFDVVEAVSR